MVLPLMRVSVGRSRWVTMFGRCAEIGFWHLLGLSVFLDGRKECEMKLSDGTWYVVIIVTQRTIAVLVASNGRH